MQLFIELFKHYIIKNIHWKHTNKICSTLNRNEVDDCTRFRKYTQLLNIIVLTFTKLAAFFWMSGSANLPWEYCLSISRWRVSQGRLPSHFLSGEYIPAPSWKRDWCMSRTLPLSSGYSKIGKYSPAALA